jgi:hypothetical protein
MRERFGHRILLVYPREWRERYGDEVRELSQELASTGHASWWRLVVGLLLSGFVERIRSWRRAKRITFASTCVILAAVAVVSLSMTPSGPFHAPGWANRIAAVAPGTDPVQPSAKVPIAQAKCVIVLDPITGAVLSVRAAKSDPTGCLSVNLKLNPVDQLTVTRPSFGV